MRHATLCDVTDEAQIGEAAKESSGRRGQIDILLNNAGILSGRSPWHTISREEMERFVDVNYLGYFLVTKAFYPADQEEQYAAASSTSRRALISWRTLARWRMWRAKAR